MDLQHILSTTAATFGDLESTVDSSERLRASPSSTMGRTWRSPSPAKEAYISSSNENSPRSTPTASSNTTVTLSGVFKRPTTPSAEPQVLQWHGLPSPQTPNFNSNAFSSPSSVPSSVAFQKHTTAIAQGSSDRPWEVQRPPAESLCPVDKSSSVLLPSPLIHQMRNEFDSVVSDSSCIHVEPRKSLTETVNANAGERDIRSIPAYVSEALAPQQRQVETDHRVDTAKPLDAVQQFSVTGDGHFGYGAEDDARFTLKLDETSGPASVRRSTRVRKKPEFVGFLNSDTINAASDDRTRLASAALRKIAPKAAPTAQVTAAPHESFVSFKAHPVPFEGLPAVQTLDWQLQYPPGGSTHPSYPYPNLDPRLLFHACVVPLTDGLPDFTRVPKLVLPMGWRHVSWSGLLPIAFDPYRQAFKLTPVGPMPLTCEELQQNGLYKYVPGGELHPETAMLPQITALSDGSSDDIYNFEGVDWTLPWAEAGSFDSVLPTTGILASSLGRGTLSPASMSSVTVVHPWRESRDCPNQVFDLSDGWRWFALKEQEPFADFAPSPKKTWRGTGAYRIWRKLKSPIPELMMLAMQTTPSPFEESLNPLLQNQDPPSTDRKCNEFCAFKSVATPTNVDITLLRNTEFTLKELLCYFPQHFYWGRAGERLTAAGLTPTAIRDIINMTRMLDGDSAVKNTTIASAMSAARKRDAENHEGRPRQGFGTTNYTAEGWVYNTWGKIDYPLLALTHGLQELPESKNAGPLTKLVKWCRGNGRYKDLISDVPALLKEAGIEPLIEPGEAECPDKEMLERHTEAIKERRLYVLRKANEQKRELEGRQIGIKSKKQKTK